MKMIERTLEIMNELKEKKLITDYAIGGGIAALFYIEPFLTYDLDLFITIPEKYRRSIIDLSYIFEHLKKKGYFFKGEHIIVEETPVQLIPADELEEESIKKSTEIIYESVKTKIIGPEYLIAILLRAGRKKDVEKIDRLLIQTDIDKKKLYGILEKYEIKEKFNKFSNGRLP